MLVPRLIHNLVGKRFLSVTPRLDFKFKLTSELIKEYEEKERAKPRKELPPLALHTQTASLIMARVSSERFNKVIKVGVPKHRLNEFLVFYIRETDTIHAYDENDICKPGDWVLLRRQKEPIDTDVHHKVERVVYSYGNWIDPLTGRRSFGMYYDDDMEKLEKIKIDI